MSDQPLALVFTMEKVGSSTVMNALRSIGRNPERGYVGNVKDLRPFDEYEKIISMVRDPVARNVSLFFERGGRDIEEFIDDFPHYEILMWFDNWVAFYFYIDIMAEPFSKRKGWQIYNDRFLLIRTEDLTEKLQVAFAELFGVAPIEVDSDHRAQTLTTREYGKEYQEFLDNLKLPEELLDRIYTSKYIDHFYYKKEIAQFRKRWS